MKVIAILLIMVGIVGLGLGGAMFGDIGIAAMVAGFVGLLSGVGFWMTSKKLSMKISG